MRKMWIDDVKYIILHTAASTNPVTKEDIDRWHIDERGFEDNGYHFIITGSLYDGVKGDIYKGRDIWYQGAHAKFSNKSIGICLTGNGDVDPFTERQKYLLSGLLQMILAKYPEISIDQIIGHRDTWWEKLKCYKTCPGTKIHMRDIKRDLILTNMNEFDPIIEAKVNKMLPSTGNWWAEL